MMRVRWPPTAEQAWLQGHELQMIAVAVAPRLTYRQTGLVDPRNTRILRGGSSDICYGKRQGSVEGESVSFRFP